MAQQSTTFRHGAIRSWRATAIATVAGNPQLDGLLRSDIIDAQDWARLPSDRQAEIAAELDCPRQLDRLVEDKLLTEYQAGRISQGAAAELIFGNYRILDFLAGGAMGCVLKGEHRRLRRLVAIKIMAQCGGDNSQAIERFVNETWIVAQLCHPNVVAALDAGEAPSPTLGMPNIQYFVMEYVPGQDLEQHVATRGALDPALACDLIYQVASALEEADKHGLVHRDIKPSNIRVTPEGQCKLVDFGMARHLQRRHTDPGTVLGSVAYLAPEQASDSSSVDIRADVYGLGGTLFWCLTGRTPFPNDRQVLAALAKRVNQTPPLVRACRSEISAELEHVVTTMMATNPDDRYATPTAVMQALFPFLKRQELPVAGLVDEPMVAALELAADDTSGRGECKRVLVVDDEPSYRHLCRVVLEAAGLTCTEAVDGQKALEAIAAQPFDLILLDVDMPTKTGIEVLRQVRENPPCPNLKVIMASGRASPDEMAEMMIAGADDYLTKPFSTTQLLARTKASLRLKSAEDRSRRLHHELLSVNHVLEKDLHARDSDLVHARNALVLALAELVAHRDSESGSHLLRMQRYSRHLAELAANSPAFARQIEMNYVNMLECCAPLHDIGKAGIPDCILLKPGRLTADERRIMETHTTIGATILEKVADRHPFARPFLRMAIDITRHHHERFDGHGYPDKLVGEAIPLAARIVAIADVYDALRARRVYKPALSHAEALAVMLDDSSGQFDPALLQIFRAGSDHFEQMYRRMEE